MVVSLTGPVSVFALPRRITLYIYTDRLVRSVNIHTTKFEKKKASASFEVKKKNIVLHQLLTESDSIFLSFS